MAEEKAQERTQQATPKRQQDAKKEGQVPRSKELNIAFLLLASGMTLALTGSNIMMTGKPVKNLKSMKYSRSQPELPTVQEMVNVRTKKESQWGIANYTVPKCGANLTLSRSSSMAKK